MSDVEQQRAVQFGPAVDSALQEQLFIRLYKKFNFLVNYQTADNRHDLLYLELLFGIRAEAEETRRILANTLVQSAQAQRTGEVRQFLLFLASYIDHSENQLPAHPIFAPLGKKGEYSGCKYFESYMAAFYDPTRYYGHSIENRSHYLLIKHNNQSIALQKVYLGEETALTLCPFYIGRVLIPAGSIVCFHGLPQSDIPEQGKTISIDIDSCEDVQVSFIRLSCFGLSVLGRAAEFAQIPLGKKTQDNDQNMSYVHILKKAEASVSSS
jgi:hypothetical protein